MKKKIIILVSTIILLVVLGIVVKNLMQNKGKSDTELIEFSIADTSTIDKIKISDAYSNAITLIKTNKTWTQENGDCVMNENVNFMLEAIKNIEFKGYLPDNSQKKFNNLMIGQHTKVEIFQNGEWTKTWYIGPAAADHYGQIMLLDSDEYGKSTFPVMMKIKGLQGIIEPRFFADARKWMCTNIFSVPIERISSVEIKNFDDPVLSFKVTKKGNDMRVFQQGKPLKNVDTSMIFRYLHQYKKIHFELANFELNKNQVDSLRKTRPFATLNLKETSGKSTLLKMYKIKAEDYQVNEFGDVVEIDMNKFWCELPNGKIVKCQYFVFNPLILGHIYFPMDLKNRKTTVKD